VDLLVPFTAVPNIWCRIFGRMARVPAVVGTCRGGDAIANQHESLLWRGAHCHVCNTRALGARLVEELGLPPERVSVIGNAVTPDIDVVSNLEEERVLCVARFEEIKDLHTLLRAFALVSERFPAASLTLVGEGALRQELMDAVDTLGLGGRVTFAPPQADLGGYYARTSVFALSSRGEGAPNVLLEAGHAGIPVVSTSVGGVPDIVDDGRTGLLVPPGEPERMADALCRLLGNVKLRREMGRAAREHIAGRYGLKAMVGGYERLFESLRR
jgi:glycosyltransferase involved in cell wall biosynthesis